MLTIRREDQDKTVTLLLSGMIDLGSILRLREAAFAAIGERPGLLCLDLRAVGQIEIAGIHTLIAIRRVAHLLKVPCLILPSRQLQDTLLQTGLVQILPFTASETGDAANRGMPPPSDNPASEAAPASSGIAARRLPELPAPPIEALS